MMDTYSPIPGLFARHPETGVMIGGIPALRDAFAVEHWQVHELIDGAQVSVEYIFDGNFSVGGNLQARINGRRERSSTTQAQRAVVFNWAAESETARTVVENMREHGVHKITFFGKLVGPGVEPQGGNLYGLDNPEFILEDILADSTWWLSQETVDTYADDLFLRRPAHLGTGPLTDIVEEMVLAGFRTQVPTDLRVRQAARGIVLRPIHELRTQNGDRLILKLREDDAVDLSEQAVTAALQAIPGEISLLGHGDAVWDEIRDLYQPDVAA